MKHAWTIFTAILICFSSTALANEDNPPVNAIPDAQVLIDACYDQAKDDFDTGSTNSIRHGFLVAAMCMKEEILENMVILVGEDEREAISKHLNDMKKAVGKFNWILYNYPLACNGSCGTMNHAVHNMRLATAFENILRDVMDQRQLYNY